MAIAEFARQRPTGVPALRHVPWGEHLCQFYRSRADLLDSLVPFFAAGLEHGERCIWVASEPLCAADARSALRAVVPDLAAREARGQIEILDHDAWYVRDGELTPDEVIAGWLSREEAAIRDGYAGLRLSGNTAWLASQQWSGFADYEARVHEAFHGRRILALCSYSLERCGTDQVIDVMKNHGAALVRTNDAWNVLHSATAVLAFAAGDASPQRHGHTVEFYQADAFPAARIAGMMHRALAARRGAAALARAANLEALRHHLGELGVDTAAALEGGALKLIEAEAVADDCWQHGELVPAVLEERVLRPLQAAIARLGRAFAFGELVDVFVERGNRPAAIVLEQWWNRQVAAIPLELHCAYSLRGFADASAVEPFREICDSNDAVCEERMQAEIDQLETALAAESKRRTALEPSRDHLIELQHVMAQLGEAVTVADVSRGLATVARERLGAVEVALYVGEPGRWHELISGDDHAMLPAGAVTLRVRGQQVGAVMLGFPAGTSRDAAHRALVQDVVHQVAHALDRARAHDAAAEANRVKDEFLAMLGHELRNPLSPIVTALQLMRMRGDEHLRKERAVIERQTGKLVELIDNLLDVSRITRGKVTIERTETELADIIMKAIESTSTAMSEASQHLHLDVPQGIRVEADPDRLAHAIANVLGNAAKYSPPGGQIHLVARATPARVRIEITDHGDGIAASLLPRVFELFVQARQGSDRARGGLGLGLAISKSIIELHGGVIGASSAGPGTGSTFTIELPRLAHVRLDGDRSTLPQTRGRRILVVDDNHDAAAMLGEALRQLGHEVELSHDGRTGLGIAKSMRPEIAILDLGLPGMDGYTLARALRTALADSCPVLFAVTGYGQPSDRQRSAEAGFSAHFVKPVALDKLEEALRRLDN